LPLTTAFYAVDRDIIHTHKIRYGYVPYKCVTPITSAKKKTPSCPNEWRQQPCDHAREERYGESIETLDEAIKTGSAKALKAARCK
jgi:hypothetical protein